MGYTTNFEGEFAITPTLKDEDRIFLTKLSATRRMKRNVDPKYGIEGEFFVDGGGEYGQEVDKTVVDNNEPPGDQPGLWCDWAPSEDGSTLAWNGGEKFYHYIEWLQYLIDKIFIPRHYELDGAVKWHGENNDDFGRIVIRKNKIEIQDGVRAYVKRRG